MTFWKITEINQKEIKWLAEKISELVLREEKFSLRFLNLELKQLTYIKFQVD